MKNPSSGFLSVLLIFFLSGSLTVNAQPHQHRHRHQYGRQGTNTIGGLHIICSFSDYASIAENLVGEMGTVEYIAHGEQDPHFVPPKPSYAMKLHTADMWVTTGMDLEMWSATILDKARNARIMDGAVGFVSVSDGVRVLQKVEKADRTEGDVHLMGNPHINTGPLNWKIIASNIATGLIKIDPANSSYYRTNLADFNDRVDRALFGDELVDIFGGETLSKLLDNNTLFAFLENDYEGEKLYDKLGGWLKEAEAFRGKKVVAYHKNWAYFTETFGLDIIGCIEAKPGIPPSAKHVEQIIQAIKQQNISLMLVASYFEKNSPRMIEDKTGIKALFLPLFVGGIPEVTDNFKLVDYWIDQINLNIQ